MERWGKFVYGALREPRLLKMRAGTVRRFWWFVAFSTSHGTPGVVTHNDDEIAADFNIQLDVFHADLETWILRKAVRTVMTEAGERRYEIAFDLLPEQEGDCRIKEVWKDDPAPQLDSFRDTGSGKGTRKAGTTGAERQAWFKERQRRIKAGLPEFEPSRDEFLAVYRSAKQPPQPHPETPQAGSSEAGNGNEAPVTDENADSPVTESSVTGNSNETPLDEREKIDERDNNSFGAAGNGNDATDEKAVVAFLSETGVTLPTGEVVRISADVAEQLAGSVPASRIYDQARWLPFRKPPDSGEWAGYFRRAIESEIPDPDKPSKRGWGAPGAWQKAEAERRAQDRAQRRAQERADREAGARAVAEQDRLGLEARIAAFEAGLSDEQSAEIYLEAEASISPIMREDLEKRRAQGKTDLGPILGPAIVSARRDAVLRRMAEALGLPGAAPDASDGSGP